MDINETPQSPQFHGFDYYIYEYPGFRADHRLVGFAGSIATSDAERIEYRISEWIHPLKSAMSWGKYLFGGKK